MNETYLAAVSIHRVERDLVVNRFSIHVTIGACTQNENWNRAQNMRKKTMEVPVLSSVFVRWYDCMDVLV